MSGVEWLRIVVDPVRSSGAGKLVLSGRKADDEKLG